MQTQPATFNFGAPFALFSEDPDWMKKLGLVGVCVLIPLVGLFQLIGYTRRAYAHARAGEKGLPDPSLGEDIGAGFFDYLKVLANVFPMVLLLMTVIGGCMFGGTMVGTLIAGAGGASGSDDAAGAAGAVGGLVMMVSMLGGYLLIFVAAFFFGILQIDMMRRIFNGETLPLFSPSVTIGAIRRAPVAFLMTWLSLLVAGMVGSSGIILCYVGVLLTLPIGIALRARTLAEWDRVVQATAPEPTDSY